MDKNYFPLLIDLSRFPALVVGGGAVALRKIHNLLEFGGKPVVIAPKVEPEIEKLNESGEIELIRRKYERGDAARFKLVFCATGDDEADLAVKKDCDEAGVLLNVADVPERCNFIMPGTIKRGNLTISVASQGAAPFFVRETRKKLQKIFPEDYAEVVDLAGELREKMIGSGAYYDPDKRKKAFDEFAAIDWLDIIQVEGKREAKARLAKILEGVGG